MLAYIDERYKMAHDVRVDEDGDLCDIYVTYIEGNGFERCVGWTIRPAEMVLTKEKVEMKEDVLKDVFNDVVLAKSPAYQALQRMAEREVARLYEVAQTQSWRKLHLEAYWVGSMTDKDLRYEAYTVEDGMVAWNNHFSFTIEEA